MNTQVWHRIGIVPREEIDYIEHELEKYLYKDFPDFSKVPKGKPGYV